jgi:hypothetical protein
MSAFEAFCANCGTSTHIDLLDAKPARLAGPGHDPALRLRELSDALFDNEDCDRLECQVCYGPGWLPARSIPEALPDRHEEPYNKDRQVGFVD